LGEGEFATRAGANLKRNTSRESHRGADDQARLVAKLRKASIARYEVFDGGSEVNTFTTQMKHSSMAFTLNGEATLVKISKTEDRV